MKNVEFRLKSLRQYCCYVINVHSLLILHYSNAMDVNLRIIPPQVASNS